MIVKSNITLHKGQDKLRLELLRNPVRYNTINVSRQWGKTVFGKELLSFFAFNYEEYEKQVFNPKFRTKKGECIIVWTSPTIRQAKKVYKETVKAYGKLVAHKDGTDRVITLITGTTIKFFGVDNPDSIRGDNCNYMICDEFAFYKEGVFDSVLRPMLNVQGKMCFFISTPKGLNEFWQYHKKGISKEFPNYKYVTGNYTENPYYNLDEVDDARKSLPSAIFEQEYLAKFTGEGATVFGEFNRLGIINEWSEPINTMEYYNGNDIAKQKDWTVSTTIDKNHKVANILRMRQMHWGDIISGIVNELKRYNPYSLIEVNGVGDPIYDLVSKEYQQIQPFITSNQTKQMIISNLVASCKVGSLKLPSKELCPELHEEMNMFTFDYSPEKRQIVYKAHEGYHDDMVISLALANMQYRRFNNLI